MLLLAERRRRHPELDSRGLLAACPELWDRTLPLRHYSRELLATERARAIFVEPDLAPLPSLG